MHGVGRLNAANNWIQKLFWIVMLLACLALFIYEIQGLTIQFLGKPISIKVTRTHEDQPFPDVTVCNLNPILYSSVIDSPPLFQIIKETSAFYGIDLSQFNRTVKKQIPNDDFATQFGPVPEITNGDILIPAKMLFPLRMLKVNDVELQSMSEDIKTFISSCKYYGKKCDHTNFERVRSDNYGFCYTFKQHKEDIKNEKDRVMIAGPSLGLELVLNVKQGEYVPYITEAAGVRVDIRKPGSKPDMTNNGFSLSIGFEISVGVKKSYLERFLSLSGEECDIKSTYRSVTQCTDDCINKKIRDVCKCRVDNKDDTALKVCEFEDLGCIWQTKQSSDVQKECSHCKISCSETNYNPVISMARWPSGNFAPIAAKTYAPNGTDFEKIRDDLLVMRVFYSSLTKEDIREEATYNDKNFVSDLGGQLGLWAGFSVLCLCEVVELVALLCMTCRSRRAEDNPVSLSATAVAAVQPNPLLPYPPSVGDIQSQSGRPGDQIEMGDFPSGDQEVVLPQAANTAQTHPSGSGPFHSPMTRVVLERTPSPPSVLERTPSPPSESEFPNLFQNIQPIPQTYLTDVQPDFPATRVDLDLPLPSAGGDSEVPSPPSEPLPLPPVFMLPPSTQPDEQSSNIPGIPSPPLDPEMIDPSGSQTSAMGGMQHLPF